MRVVAAAVFLAASLDQSALLPPQSALQRRLVTTDVRGRPVDDLKLADFELREEGAVVPIESVRLVRVAAKQPGDGDGPVQSAADERQAAGTDDARLFAIFL